MLENLLLATFVFIASIPVAIIARRYLFKMNNEGKTVKEIIIEVVSIAIVFDLFVLVKLFFW
jgi:hypothetical protein